MPDWSIKIVPAARPTPDEPAAFVPDPIGAQPLTRSKPGERHRDLEQYDEPGALALAGRCQW
jgi:hypothetical protein